MRSVLSCVPRPSPLRCSVRASAEGNDCGDPGDRGKEKVKVIHLRQGYGGQESEKVWNYCQSFLSIGFR